MAQVNGGVANVMKWINRQHQRAVTACRLIAMIALGAAWNVWAEPLAFQLDPARSVFAIVTHKAGFASAFGHSHLINATNYNVSLSADPDNLTLSHFEFQTRVEDLHIDDPALAAKLRPTLLSLAIKDVFPDLSSSDRDGLRKNMSSASQLDLEHFPLIGARLVKIHAARTQVGEVVFNHIVDMQITLRGRSVTYRVPTQITVDQQQLEASALGELSFSDFGIEPISAVGGLVRVKDRFHLYVSLKAARQFEATPH